MTDKEHALTCLAVALGKLEKASEDYGPGGALGDKPFLYSALLSSRIAGNAALAAGLGDWRMRCCVATAMHLESILLTAATDDDCLVERRHDMGAMRVIIRAALARARAGLQIGAIEDAEWRAAARADYEVRGGVEQRDVEVEWPSMAWIEATRPEDPMDVYRARKAMERKAKARKRAAAAREVKARKRQVARAA